MGRERRRDVAAAEAKQPGEIARRRVGSLGFSSCLGLCLSPEEAPLGTASCTLAAVREGSAKGLASSSSSLTKTVRCEPSLLVEDDIVRRILKQSEASYLGRDVT